MLAVMPIYVMTMFEGEKNELSNLFSSKIYFSYQFSIVQTTKWQNVIVHLTLIVIHIGTVVSIL